jgi:hypothetical protein
MQATTLLLTCAAVLKITLCKSILACSNEEDASILNCTLHPQTFKLWLRYSVLIVYKGNDPLARLLLLQNATPHHVKQEQSLVANTWNCCNILFSNVKHINRK